MKTGIKTKVDYKIMSNRECSDCGHPIKENVIMRIPTVELCYHCFKLSQGKRYYYEHGIKKDRLEIKKGNIKMYKGEVQNAA